MNPEPLAGCVWLDSAWAHNRRLHVWAAHLEFKS